MHFDRFAAPLLRSALILSFAICGSARAGNANGATIQRLEMQSGSQVAFIQVAGATGTPACAASAPSSGAGFALDLRTPEGQTAFGLALAAHARGIPINVTGSGACGLGKSAEAATTVTLAQPWNMQPPYVPATVARDPQCKTIAKWSC